MKKRILLITKTRKSFWSTKQSEVLVSRSIYAKEEFGFLLAFSPLGEFLSFVLVVLKGIVISANYQLVIIGDARIGFIYAFFKKFTKNKVPVLVDQLILSESHSTVESFKNSVRKFLFSEINGAIVNSEVERNIYGSKLRASINKFFFLPIFVEDDWIIQKPDGKSENYIFSGGGALRDYKTLFEVARGLPYKFKIIAFDRAIVNLSIPKNCLFLKPVPVDKYLDEIRKSLFVVVPLLPTSRAAGQTTVLQSMASRKAVIVSDNLSIRDYLTEGKDGLTVEPEDSDSLKQAIKKLYSEKKLRDSLAESAYQKIVKNFNSDSYTNRLNLIISKLS